MKIYANNPIAPVTIEGDDGQQMDLSHATEIVITLLPGQPAHIQITKAFWGCAVIDAPGATVTERIES